MKVIGYLMLITAHLIFITNGDATWDHAYNSKTTPDIREESKCSRVTKNLR